jgi:hypothetical protein
MAKRAARAPDDQAQTSAGRNAASAQDSISQEPATQRTGVAEPEPEEDGWVAYPPEEIEPMEPGDAARYIAQMTRELAAMAASAQLETLSYLLSMSAAEAEIAAQESEEAQ